MINLMRAAFSLSHRLTWTDNQSCLVSFSVNSNVWISNILGILSRGPVNRSPSCILLLKMIGMLKEFFQRSDCKTAGVDCHYECRVCVIRHKIREFILKLDETIVDSRGVRQFLWWFDCDDSHFLVSPVDGGDFGDRVLRSPSKTCYRARAFVNCGPTDGSSPHTL